MLAVASRTDRGVSARGNALLLPSSLPAPRLLRALNGLVPEVFFTHARAVEPGFLPRRATGRTYRYLEPARYHDLGRWKELARGFVGTWDVRSFGRGLPPDVATLRTVNRVEVAREGPWLVVEFEGRSFVWGMVRKIVAAMRAAEAGEITETELDAARRGESRLAIPLAEPQGLILWEVHYPFRWGRAVGPLDQPQRRFWAEQKELAALRSAVLQRVAPRHKSGGRAGRPVSA
jgi:tRNA pseudouridine38-40 synthase